MSKKEKVSSSKKTAKKGKMKDAIYFHKTLWSRLQADAKDVYHWLAGRSKKLAEEFLRKATRAGESIDREIERRKKLFGGLFESKENTEPDPEETADPKPQKSRPKPREWQRSLEGKLQKFWREAKNLLVGRQ